MASPLTSNIPIQSKKGGGVFTTNSARRPSLSANGSSTHLPPGIGFSPGLSNTPPASSGIPAFRTLRSLLPFGPNKNATPNALSSPNISKSPFSGFGSVRRSMQKDRERNVSLSNDLLRPVITIERNSPDDGLVRRSVSFSDLDRPDPEAPTTPRNPTSNTSAFALRTPSPGPPLSIELSTIMEADNSGVSKNPPSLKAHNSSTPSLPITPQRNALSSHINPATSNPQTSTKEVGDTSALDLSTAHVADQVRNAILSSDASANSVKQWHNADKSVVIIDADESDNLADTSFDLDKADPQLVVLLSPNSLKNANAALEKRKKFLQPPATTSPAGSSFTGSPSSRLPRARQASSFLPRLRPSTAPSPPESPQSVNLATPSPTSAVGQPKSAPAKGKTPIIAINGNDHSIPLSSKSLSATTQTPGFSSHRMPSLSSAGRLFTPDRSNSFSYSQGRALASEKESNGQPIASVSSAPAKGPVRTLRRVVLGMTGLQANNGSTVATPTPSPTRLATFGRASLDLPRPTTSASDIGLGRPSLEFQRHSSSHSRRRPSPTAFEVCTPITPERSTTPATNSNTESSTPEIPYQEPTLHRPSVDSTARPSLDGCTMSRPGSSAAKERERRTPSSRMFDSSGDRLSAPKVPRSRKRSMSVQERVGKAARLISGSGNIDTSVSRPGSSLSVGRPSRGGFGISENGGKLSGSGPKPEWLGPRTVKAFRAAGLLDPDREKGLRERDASGSDALERLRGGSSGMLAPSPLGNNIGGGGGSGSLSAVNRFASLRTSADHNMGPRTHSRTAFSETGGVISRRGSESQSAYSGGNGFGLMESPTFTGSSGSRTERDTPRSASTAPTSLSDTFGYFGRDRERDRDRDRDKEEIRELKDRHATEVAALLGALSDSQRTVKMLRDENSGLRERLDGFAGVLEANDELRQICADLQREYSDLRRECAGLRRECTPVSLRSTSALRAPGMAPSWSGGSTSSSLRTTIPKLAVSSPLATDVTPRYESEEYSNTIIIHDSIDERPALPNQQHQFTDDEGASPLDDLLPSSTSTPSANRRHSNTSSVSIFPAPPHNMTMLLDDHDVLPISNRSSADHSLQFHFRTGSPTPVLSTPKAQTHSRTSSLSSPPLVTFKDLSNGGGHYPNRSVVSGANISPTTAEFSMVTGSPRSLFLRPEHEQLLGDLESLDLGAIPPIDLGMGGRDDW